MGTGATTALLAAAHLANDMLTSVLPALLPALGQRFALGGPELALLVAVFALSTSLPQPLFGGLADRLGGRLVGSVGLAASATLVGLIGRAPSVPFLVALLLAGGLGSAALHPAGVGMARHLGGPHRGLGLAIFSASGMLGSALGPVLALVVVARFGMSATAWVMVPGVLAAGLLYRFGPRHTGPAPGLAAATRSLDARLVRGPVGLLTLAGVLTSLAVLTFTSAIPLWLVGVKGVPADSEVIGWTLSAFAGAAAVGGLSSGAVAKHLPRTPLIVGTLLLSLVALQGVLLATPGGGVYFTLVALAGGLLFAHTPLLVLTAQELAPGRESAAAGLVLGVTSAVAGVLYAGVGRLQPALGLTATLGLVFSGVVPAALLARAVLRPHRTAAVASADDPAVVAGCLCGECGGAVTCEFAHTGTCACPLHAEAGARRLESFERAHATGAAMRRHARRAAAALLLLGAAAYALPLAMSGR